LSRIDSIFKQNGISDLMKKPQYDPSIVKKLDYDYDQKVPAEIFKKEVRFEESSAEKL
jgi:hypothetical protein